MDKDASIEKEKKEPSTKKKSKISSWLLPPVKKVANVSFVNMGFLGMLKATFISAANVITRKVDRERDETWVENWKQRWGIQDISDYDLELIKVRMLFEMRIFGFFVVLLIFFAFMFATFWDANGWSPVFFSLAAALYILAPLTLTWWRYQVITEDKYMSFMEWISRK